MRLIPRNWSEFQHYKDRDPSWIKLHKKLLDDYEFQCLPVASRALAPMLWLLSSESRDGIIDAEKEKLAFRLRMKVSELDDALKPLIMAKFFSVEQDASSALADCDRDSIPEKESKKQVETEKELFIEFWLVCPKKVGKGAAKRAYSKAISKTSPETIRAGMVRYAATRAGQPEEFTKHPATWLNAECWLDEGTETTGPPPTPEQIAENRDRADKLMRRGKYAEGIAA